MIRFFLLRIAHVIDFYIEHKRNLGLEIECYLYKINEAIFECLDVMGKRNIRKLEGVKQ